MTAENRKNPFRTNKNCKIFCKISKQSAKNAQQTVSARGTIRDAARVLYDRAHSARPCVRHFGLNRSFPTQSRRRVERRIAVLVAEKAWMLTTATAQPCV